MLNATAQNWLNGVALLNPAYLHDRLLIARFGPLQVIFLVVMVFTAVLKPWEKGINDEAGPERKAG